MSFKINWLTHVKCIVIAGVIALILHPTIYHIVRKFIFENFWFFDNRFPIVRFYIAILILMIPISAVHELIHGIVYKLFGGKVKFGFKGIYAYTQETSQKPLTKLQFLIVLISPLVTISLVSLIIGDWLGGMLYILNFLGSSGDIYMVFILCKYKDTCMVIDRSYGFDIV